MEPLKKPGREDFARLKEMCTPNADEKAYLDLLKQRMETTIPQNDFKAIIEFYFNELKERAGAFPARIAVIYQLKCRIGHTYESWATKGFGPSSKEGGDPLERAGLFEQAILWYHLADETTGYYSDAAFRQAEACGGAAHFRKLAGLDDEVTKAYVTGAVGLLGLLLGGNGNTVTITTDAIPSHPERLADQTIHGAVNAYTFRKPNKGEIQ